LPPDCLRTCACYGSAREFREPIPARPSGERRNGKTRQRPSLARGGGILATGIRPIEADTLGRCRLASLPSTTVFGQIIHDVEDGLSLPAVQALYRKFLNGTNASDLPFCGVDYHDYPFHGPFRSAPAARPERRARTAAGLVGYAMGGPSPAGGKQGDLSQRTLAPTNKCSAQRSKSRTRTKATKKRGKALPTARAEFVKGYRTLTRKRKRAIMRKLMVASTIVDRIAHRGALLPASRL
jgi:hypothetical protein